MVPYLKDESKCVNKQRSNWGKGKSEWYTRHQTAEQKERRDGQQNKCVELKFGFLH